MPAKYIVGIDLGTTNSALARCDATAAEEESRIEVQGIPQLVNPNEVAERTLLPSFLYIPGEVDFPKGSTALPWDAEPKFVVGELARKRGAERPNRLVASAKSWLSYAAVNRTAPILPWQAPEEVPKLSPVEASAQFLQYLDLLVADRYQRDGELGLLLLGLRRCRARRAGRRHRARRHECGGGDAELVLQRLDQLRQLGNRQTFDRLDNLLYLAFSHHSS